MPPNQIPTPQTPTSSPAPGYDFILQPNQPKKKVINLAGKSMLGKAVFVLVAFLGLVIVFIIIKNLLTTQPFNESDYLTVLQQQQEMINILTNDVTSSQEQAALSLNNQDFIATATLSIGSAQNNLIKYLADNHKKVSAAQEKPVGGAAIDTDLSNALTTNNFNQTFSRIMQSQLSNYEQDLTRAYRSTHGPKGRAALSSAYQDAQLLIKELNLPES